LLDGATYIFNKNEKALGLPGVKNLEVQDWLYYLINAKFVITDSYHGTCFSILFNKDFITIGNKIRGLTRFKMVLGLTKLENRFVFEPAEIIENEKLLEPINYDYANKVLNIEIEKTRKWLLNALAAPKKIRFVEIVAILKRTIIARILKKLTSYFYLKIKEINKPKSQKPEQQD
ncbi:MAG: polysaccharide pyruvyl transferase family protein, partial [Spirochaetota bacterium]|nr:polysaccharide pyruvyl transferase family protein [Spirochaetota bacterium]